MRPRTDLYSSDTPVTVLRVVVFPAPFEPMIETHSPFRTSNETPFSASTAP